MWDNYIELFVSEYFLNFSKFGDYVTRCLELNF